MNGESSTPDTHHEVTLSQRAATAEAPRASVDYSTVTYKIVSNDGFTVTVRAAIDGYLGLYSISHAPLLFAILACCDAVSL